MFKDVFTLNPQPRNDNHHIHCYTLFWDAYRKHTCVNTLSVCLLAIYRDV